jgi:NADP-dependent 3-hydroxy acid dehydrogenase YdfG
MDNVSGRWALVTGASSGFGVEFAKLLAERNANVVLAARRTGPMERLAEQLRQRHRVNVVVEGINLGVTGAAAELKSRLDRRDIVIDILLNNAGHGLYGEFVDQPLPKDSRDAAGQPDGAHRAHARFCDGYEEAAVGSYPLDRQPSRLSSRARLCGLRRQ